MRYALIAVALLASGCASAPSAPSAAPTVQPPARTQPGLPIVISGQSNAANLRYYAFFYPAFFGHPIYPQAVTCEGCQANTVISAWAPGSELWAQLDAGLHQPLTAFVWWQGETDGYADNRHYTADVRGLFQRVRAANGNPTLLIVIVQVLLYQNNQFIRDQQAEVARLDPNVLMVNVDDLPSDGYNHVSWPEGYEMSAQRILAAIATRY